MMTMATARKETPISITGNKETDNQYKNSTKSIIFLVDPVTFIFLAVEAFVKREQNFSTRV